MSMYLTAAAFKIKVGNGLRKLVLLKLADNANDNGECFPSIKHIAKECEMGRTTVKSHIKALEELGFIYKIERKIGNINTSNLYRMNFGFVGKDVVVFDKEEGGSPADLGGHQTTEGGSPADLGGGSPADHIINHISNQSINHSADAPVLPDDKTESTRKQFNAIVKVFNATFENVPAVRVVSLDAKKENEKRIKLVPAAWAFAKQRVEAWRATGVIDHEPTAKDVLAWFEGYFASCAQDEFINGTAPRAAGHKNWRADFGYMMRMTTIEARVLEAV